jgi:hypothetical protein
VFAWLIIFYSLLSTFSFEHALSAVLVLYIFSQTLAFLLTPLSAPALRFGMRRALAFGTLFAAFMCTSLALLFASGSPFSFFALVGAFVVFSALHRALYWVPYESVDPTLSRIPLPELALVFLPFTVGLLISAELGAIVFAAGALCALLALIPLLGVPERVESFEWNISETISAFFARKNRTLVMLGVLDGIQGAALLLLWPISVFIIVRGNWLLLGTLLSGTLLITHLLRSRVQKALKRIRADRSDTLLALLAFSAWGARVAAPVPFAILSADVFASTTISPKRFSVEPHAGEQYADGGHFIDEYTALKEMALHLGRIAACALCIALLSFSVSLALGGTLFLAGCAAATSLVLARRAARALYVA